MTSARAFTRAALAFPAAIGGDHRTRGRPFRRLLAARRLLLRLRLSRDLLARRRRPCFLLLCRHLSLRSQCSSTVLTPRAVRTLTPSGLPVGGRFARRGFF